MAIRRCSRKGPLGGMLLALAISACSVPDDAVTVSAIMISPSSVRLAKGAAETLVARVLDTRGRTLASVPVHWRSLDERTVTINSSGTARGLAAGEARIVAEAGGRRSPEILVQVVPASEGAQARRVPVHGR